MFRYPMFKTAALLTVCLLAAACSPFGGSLIRPEE